METRKGPYQRKLGFAFVEFALDDDADRAIAQFNGQPFLRRNILIKKAVPPLTDEEKQERNKAYKEKKQAIAAEKKRKKDEARQRQQELPVTDAEAAAAATATATTTTPTTTAPTAKVPEGDPSPDTIFVTNLDYRVTVLTLKSLFKELEPKWVYIPLRKTQWKGRQPGRRAYNKGIAFVKFLLPEVQAKAIAEFNGAEVQGRNIVVDVAINTRASDAERAEEEAAGDDSLRSSSQDAEPEKKKPRAKARAKKAKTPNDGAAAANQATAPKLLDETDAQAEAPVVELAKPPVSQPVAGDESHPSE